jgi:hypothetical protein
VVICVSMRGFAKCVLLLQMAYDEEVEDLGDLDSTLPEASTVELAPPSDVGKGPSATLAPTGAGEGPAPAPALTGEDALKTVVEPATEDPAAAGGPSQVAE